MTLGLLVLDFAVAESRARFLAIFLFRLTSSPFCFEAVLSLNGARLWLLASAATLAVHTAIDFV
jgi:hypothetical protein